MIKLICLYIISIGYADQFKKAEAVPSLTLETQIVQLYNQKIKGKQITAILIEGHTDSSGSHVYNLKLSQQRANSAAKLIVKLGVDEQLITKIGLGKTQLLSDNMAANRRVVIHVFGIEEKETLVISNCSNCQIKNKKNIISGYVVNSQNGLSRSSNGTTIRVDTVFEEGAGVMYQRKITEDLWLGGAFDSNSGKFISLGIEF